MRRTLLATAVSVASLFALGGTALADDTPPVAATLPTPAPVTDNATAANFARIYVARNAGTFLGVDRHRVRVTSDDAVCLAHPAVANRWGCVFVLRAAVLERTRSWDSWRAASKRGHAPPRRVRIRQFGCLGALTINGGPTVTPTATVRFVDCVRLPRDLVVTPTT